MSYNDTRGHGTSVTPICLLYIEQHASVLDCRIDSFIRLQANVRLGVESVDFSFRNDPRQARNDATIAG